MEIPIEKLKQQLESEKPNYEDFESCFYELKNAQKELQNLLEYASDFKRPGNKTDEENKFENLYRRVAGVNSSEIIETLKRKGNDLKKDLGTSFENMGYRLLEQTRAGKRDDVYYGILRIFVANKMKFPDELVEAFKPIYSDEMFKVFIFSFLSGIIGKE
ncbi:MAG: hypothetical protein QHH13_06600 [Melioribacter sp.]|uniref:hypothetical protein n=1 Tax=Rosettibacter primus TaxID=3111523 RepID=UPI00247C5CAA|nr:hypothetical protein [Melioribacter sp.]